MRVGGRGATLESRSITSLQTGDRSCLIISAMLETEDKKCLPGCVMKTQPDQCEDKELSNLVSFVGELKVVITVKIIMVSIYHL